MERLTHSGTKEAKNDVTIKEILARLTEYEDTGLTPEQVQQLKERDTDMKVKRDGDDLPSCPCCGSYNVYYCEEDKRYDFCPNCGQKIDWSE